MATQYEQITERLQQFIAAQQMYFVGTAAPDGRVNVSPKGLDSLRVLGPNRVVWLNGTGSGNETAAHLLRSPRITMMFCAFEGKPLILRLYGKGRVAFRGSPDYRAFLNAHYAGQEPLGARQIVFLDIDLVQTSCGFKVPLFEPAGERPTLDRWAEAKGEDGLRAYRQEKNLVSMDGLSTGFVES